MRVIALQDNLESCIIHLPIKREKFPPRPSNVTGGPVTASPIAFRILLNIYLRTVPLRTLRVTAFSCTVKTPGSLP